MGDGTPQGRRDPVGYRGIRSRGQPRWFVAVDRGVRVVVVGTSDIHARGEQWLRSPRRVLLVTVPLLALALIAVVAYLGGSHIDLEVYRSAVGVWMAGGDIYGPLPPTSDGAVLPFIYPPFAALLMVPLTVVPWVVAWGALLAVSTLSLAVTLYVVARRLWPSGGPGVALSVASLGLPFALALEPVLQTLQFGQVNLLLMALVALDCLVDRPRWPRGMLIGIAAAIKLTPAAFVLYFLLRRDYRAAGVAVLSGVAATAIGFAVAPAASLRFWLDNPAGGVSGSPFFTNQTFEAVLVRIGVDGVARAGAWLLLTVALLTLTVPVIRRGPAPLALVVTAAVALLVSPTSWSHHWIWVAPALLVGAATACRVRSGGRLALTLAVAVVFVVAPHQLGLPRSGEVELTWTPVEQLVGSTFVWFTVLVLVAVRVSCRARPGSVVDTVPS